MLGVLTWRRGSVRAVLGVSVVLALASGLWLTVQHVPGSDPTRVYFGTDTRAAAVLLGAALAAWLVWRGPTTSPRARIALEVVAIGAAMGLAWAWLRVDGRGDGLYEGGLFVSELAVVAVIAAVSHPRSGPLAAVFSFAPLRALGIVSYGVYLWHWPIYVALSPVRTGLDGLRLTGLRVACTFVVAGASYFALERPIRRGALGKRAIRVAAPLTAAIVIATVLVATLGAAPVVDAAALGRDRIPSRGPTPGTTRIMVVGDSVGASLALALKANGTPAKAEVLNRAIVGCKFVDSGKTDYDLAGRVIQALPCAPSWPADVAAARPDVVLVALSGSYGPAEESPCSRRWDRAYGRNLRDAVALFRDWDARVVLTTSAYPTKAAVAAKVAQERIDCVNRIDRQVAASTGSEVVDLLSYLCPRGVCRWFNPDGEQLRPDGTHFSRDAGPTVGRWVLQQVMKRGPGAA